MLRTKPQSREAFKGRLIESGGFEQQEAASGPESQNLKQPDIAELLKFAKEGYLHADHIYDHPDGLVFYTTNFIAKTIERALFQNGYSVEIHPIAKEQYVVYIPEQFRNTAEGSNWYLWERKKKQGTEILEENEQEIFEPSVEVEDIPEIEPAKLTEPARRPRPVKEPISFTAALKGQIESFMSGKLEAADFETFVSQKRREHQALTEGKQKAA